MVAPSHCRSGLLQLKPWPSVLRLWWRAFGHYPVASRIFPLAGHVEEQPVCRVARSCLPGGSRRAHQAMNDWATAGPTAQRGLADAGRNYARACMKNDGTSILKVSPGGAEAPRVPGLRRGTWPVGTVASRERSPAHRPLVRDQLKTVASDMCGIDVRVRRDTLRTMGPCA